MDADGAYYLSFLFRRLGQPSDVLNTVAILLRTTDEFEPEREDPRERLNIGVGTSNHLFTHLQRLGSRTPIPLSSGETYLLVAKIATASSGPDQVSMRVYAPDEPIELVEPSTWTAVGPPTDSNLVFDWLELHINSKARQVIDEVRVATTWSAATAPWVVTPPVGDQGKP